MYFIYHTVSQIIDMRLLSYLLKIRCWNVWEILLTMDCKHVFILNVPYNTSRHYNLTNCHSTNYLHHVTCSPIRWTIYACENCSAPCEFKCYCSPIWFAQKYKRRYPTNVIQSLLLHMGEKMSTLECSLFVSSMWFGQLWSSTIERYFTICSMF